jgi:hypothetical protein
MKSSFYLILFGILQAAALMAGGKKDTSSPDTFRPGASAAPQNIEQTASAIQSYFAGEGRRGMRLTVLPPGDNGLGPTEQYLVSLVQGSVTGDFNKYSAITVLDRQNLDTILEEQNLSLSGNFSGDDYISIGRLTNTQYILAGSITKTGNSYILEFGVSNVETGEQKASFPPRTCTAAELQGLSAVKDATEDLLSQLGVILTPEGKTALHKTRKSAVEAETALSRGITAQKSGAIVEALNYYYDAVSFDSSLAEAGERLSVLSSAVVSGNIGKNVRNDIQRRNEWKKILGEAETFFTAHRPWEFVYEPVLKQEDIDYKKETVDLSFPAKLVPTTGLETIKNIRQGLKATGKARKWGFSGDWPAGDYWIDEDRNNFFWKPIGINAALINNAEKIIAVCQDSFRIVHSDRSAPHGFYVYGDGNIKFSGVNVNDITDNLTIKITGMDAESAGSTGYIKITAAEPGWKDAFGNDFNRAGYYTFEEGGLMK